jgi:Mn2+/Fe2+ NRAMP family transporter
MAEKRNFFDKLGPGLLLAATSIGASHLVMSPNAGARFGYQLLWLVLVTHVFKYHAFEFGPRYAAATGQSLIAGYMRIPGPRGWALWIFLFGTIAQGIAVLAGVAGIAASVLFTFFGHTSHLWYNLYSALIITSILVLLFLGGYDWLDLLNKIMMAVLLIATAIVFIPVCPPPAVFVHFVKPSIPAGSIAVVAALLGWMPTGIDVSIWHSLWTLEKHPQLSDADSVLSSTERRKILNISLTDMRLGYLLSFLVASVFLILAALFLHGTSSRIEGVGFSKNLADIYAQRIGPWMIPVFMIAAFFAMYSTTYTVMDGFSRCFAETLCTLLKKRTSRFSSALYWSFVLTIGIVAFLLIITVGQPVKLVMVVALISFAVAPLYYALNYYCVRHFITNKSFQPSTISRLIALAGIMIMFLAALVCIASAFGVIG